SWPGISYLLTAGFKLVQQLTEFGGNWTDLRQAKNAFVVASDLYYLDVAREASPSCIDCKTAQQGAGRSPKERHLSGILRWDVHAMGVEYLLHQAPVVRWNLGEIKPFVDLLRRRTATGVQPMENQSPQALELACGAPQQSRG